ncbi:MAG: DNA polymerase II, partial [Gammaproteobacteria bacterium]|nr:DNA polymerase II [Gammaproteobacteria bacterium]
MTVPSEHRCFLLTRQWRDTRDGLELSFWGAAESGPVRVTVRGEQAVCFVAQADPLPGMDALAGAERRPLALASLAGSPVDGLYFRTQRDLAAARELARGHGLELHESDIKPSDRYLMERFVTAGFRVAGRAEQRDGFVEVSEASMKRDDYRPRLSRVSVDVESNGLSGELYSIAVHGERDALVFMVSERVVDAGDVEVRACADERALLGAF